MKEGTQRFCTPNYRPKAVIVLKLAFVKVGQPEGHLDTSSLDTQR